MSTQLMNTAGEVVAVRFHGGADRGPVAQILMPRSIAMLMEHLPVHEEPTPEFVGTLGLWTLDMEAEGRTIVYGADLVGDARLRTAA